MPFTPSHMAAALPFVRTPLIPAALAIGTMAPDVPYYIPLGVPRGLTHSLPGVIIADLPMTIVLTLMWFAVLRAPLIDLSPRFLRERMPARGVLGWRAPDRRWLAAVGILICSALVGILTHVAWDSFTHGGWLVDALPLLATRLGPLPLHTLLQHASTIGGLVALALWGRYWVRRTPPIEGRPDVAGSRFRSVSWIAVVVAFGAAGFIAWMSGIVRGVAPFDPSLVFLGATVAGAVAGATGFAVCAAWWISRGVRRSTSPV